MPDSLRAENNIDEKQFLQKERKSRKKLRIKI